MKKKIGVVSKTKTNKTITVCIRHLHKHIKYNIFSEKKNNYLVHDENNDCKEGMVVLIEEHNPLSCKKAWVLNKIISLPK